MSLSNPTGSPGLRRTPGDPQLRERDQRIDSLKAVAGKLAHDFNNFLAPQYGYLTLLKDEIASGSTAASYVAAMEGAAHKAEKYISSILVGMRPHRQFSPREFQFDRTLWEILERWKSETLVGTNVMVSAQLEPFVFSGDEKQWRIVFEQLLANARYALAMGGELSVTLQRHLLPGEEVQRLGVGTDDVFCLRVRDTGFGMNAEAARRAFEPFFTTRTQIKALGLGLSLVHGITLFHGGQVELSTGEDSGTVVTVWVPAGGIQPVDQFIPEIASPGIAVKDRKKVLLIADDPLVKEVLRGWIARHELETETASNEKEARRSLQRSGEKCVLVIIDADLKSGPGEYIYSSLSDVNLAAPWVFLSAQRAPQLGHLNGRAEPLVMKRPLSHNAFSDLVRKYANR